MAEQALPRRHPAQQLLDRLQRAVAGASIETMLLVAVGALAVAVRALPVLRADFPLNDGGLFYVMVRDVQSANYALPAQTSYNGEGIPFAYPPLGFYIAALADDLTPIPLLDLFRFLPLVFTCLTVYAVYRLARVASTSPAAVVAAVLAFALIPRSYIWLLMGGGLTRALGVFFAVLCLEQVYLLYTRGGNRPFQLAAVFAAATVLSHLEAAWFLAFSIVVFWITLVPGWGTLFRSAKLAMVTLLLVSPWLVAVMAQHGPAPFLAANQTGGNVFSDPSTRDLVFESLLRPVSTGEPFFPAIGALALLGALACFASGRFLLPLWWAAIILLDVRAFATYSAIPVALLAGIAADEAILPMLRQLQARAGGADGGRSAISFAPALGPGAILLISSLVCYATVASMARRPGTEQAVALVPLPSDERAAMEWIGTAIPQGSRVIVMPSTSWETARALEWFPALTGSGSVATVQGSEWLQAGTFQERIEDYYQLARCQAATEKCLTSWEERTGLYFSYVFIPGSKESRCCHILSESLAEAGYTVVYDTDGGIVLARPSSP